MPQLTRGEKLIQLLRGYAPVMENTAMTAEHIGELKKKTGIEPIFFTHPAKERLRSALRPELGLLRNVILTGTAGDGKTSVCFDLYRELTQEEPDVALGLQTVPFETNGGPRRLTFIYDITAWREPVGQYLPQEQVTTLATFARSVFGEGDDYFVIAVNDGQLHEVFEYLPEGSPRVLAELREEISRLHVSGIEDSSHRLRLINLSKISSEELMRRCLDAILERDEWRCFEEESEHPLFSPKSSLYRNFKLLRTSTVRNRLITLAQIADAAGYHLPIRGILCLLANALLGNPAAKDGVLRPHPSVAKVIEQAPHESALHRTLFGEHLSSVTRTKREVYRFLSMLQIGVETTNDLDELLVFGAYDPEIQQTYREIVEPDPYHQRNPELPALTREYVRGELNQEDTSKLLRELSMERRRLFLTADDQTFGKYNLWHTSVFHHAGDYIQKLLKPLKDGNEVERPLVQRLVAGLNRAWTGLLLTSRPDELYLCTGLDVTTASVSDILCAEIEITGNWSSRIEVCLSQRIKQPEMVIRLGERSFELQLTLARFEFLCRVADGTMPNSFSRESAEDFAMLKQRCIAALAPNVNEKLINGIRITPWGKIERAPIHLPHA